MGEKNGIRTGNKKNAGKNFSRLTRLARFFILALLQSAYS